MQSIREARMPLESDLSLVLTQPATDSLWNLRADLLERADQLAQDRHGRAELSLAIVDRFHQYLADLQSKMSAHEYSRIAAKMDIGSVGLLALQDLVTNRDQLFKTLFLGGLSEGLMLLATFQYAKAWKTEVRLVNDEALWWLFRGFWQVSRQLRPDVAADTRRAQIDALLEPARSPDVEPAVKAAIIARMFQVLLIGSLSWVSSDASNDRG